MNASHDCVAELHGLGLRATGSRLAILHVLEKAKRPLAAAEVAHAVPRVNEVTVYRTLESLALRGVLRAGERNRVMRYSYAAHPHHHHLICADCGYEQACRNC